MRRVTRSAAAAAAAPEQPEQPTYDPRALYVRLKREPELRAIAESLPGGVNDVPQASPLMRYLGEHPEARLTGLYPALAVEEYQDGNWNAALPRSSRHISALHHLSVANAEERVRLEEELKHDPFVFSFRQPVLQYPVGSVPPAEITAEPPTDRQWALTVCRFREVWDCLDVGADPGPVAVLDQGDDLGNGELASRIRPGIPGRPGTSAFSSHAGEVCSVISAKRDGVGMDGCCSSMIDLYNVCAPDGTPESKAYAEALAAVSRSNARVVNISLSSAVRDPDVAQQIANCIAQGIVVVVAMGNQGNDGSPVRFPTAEPDVIAVGATDSFGRRPAWASSGQQMFIAAPGEQILAASGASALGTASGTSYSAAIVSAAVWLMLRARPGLSVAQVREILQKSVDTQRTGGARTVGLGYGQLDMVKLALNLVQVRNCPAGP